MSRNTSRTIGATVLQSRSSRRLSLGFLVSLLLWVAAGCGLDSERPRHHIVDIGEPVRQTTEYSSPFNQTGGTLGGSDASFVIPPNALSVTTTITMSVSVISSPESLIEADMGPDDQIFLVPCTLTIRKPTGYNSNDVYHIALWDEDNSEWDDMGGTDNGNSVSLSVSHFSRYMIIREETN